MVVFFYYCMLMFLDFLCIACMYVPAYYMDGHCRVDQKRALGVLELELWVVVSHHVEAGH